MKEEFTLEYLLAQHSHVQSLIEKNRRRLDVLPQKRIWYRNSCLNENIHLYLTELRDRLENFLLDQYRQERDGYIDFPCQQHYLTKDLFKLFSLCDEFEQMKQQILQPPTNSTELLTRSAYLEEARTKPLIQLVASVAALKTHFITLTQVVSYTEEDVSKSAYVFFGPDQIIPMLDISVEVRFQYFHCRSRVNEKCEFQSIAQYRKQFEETYLEVLEKTQRDIRRLNAKIKNFSNFSEYEAVEEYVKVSILVLS